MREDLRDKKEPDDDSEGPQSSYEGTAVSIILPTENYKKQQNTKQANPAI